LALKTIHTGRSKALPVTDFKEITEPGETIGICLTWLTHLSVRDSGIIHREGRGIDNPRIENIIIQTEITIIHIKYGKSGKEKTTFRGLEIREVEIDNPTV